MHDGNIDFRWSKGACFTSKHKEIWNLQNGVSAEDVSHMQARCEAFHCSGTIRRRRGGVPQCRKHLTLWIRSGAAAWDAQQALGGQLPHAATLGGAAGSQPIAGFRELLEEASISHEAAAALEREVRHLGTIHVRELSRADWGGLHAWADLREMERRRILARVKA